MTIFPSKLEITKQKTKQNNNNNNNNQIDPCLIVILYQLTASPGGPASPTVPCFPVSP